ncbi:hypothetical protein M404DRAFT_20964 [Pisolithus tinctorius Marx 270]|uniref:Uncharacterized protein n=1 Tax=Pisolithus tinctorius Marx 270 TaxID=870435 RepID=A0A0C3KM73_PISTI|nr:hypothetical protein M404DRAFT_20964 [Pisolithus tinctorius Marx 270]
MAPKRDASQSKEASPSKRIRITTSAPTTTNSTTDNPTVEQSRPPTPLPTTLSPPHEPVSGNEPSYSKPDPSSTPSTDTLPGSRASVQTTSTSSQTTPSNNTQLPSAIIQGTIGTVRPTPDPGLFDPNRISTCPEPLLKLIRAVRWQSPRSGGNPVLFNSIYDAREILKSKSTMKKLDISYLEKRALVLLETHFTRYRQKDVNSRWTISKAQFELQAIYLLQDPCLPNPEQEKESGVEIAGLAI